MHESGTNDDHIVIPMVPKSTRETLTFDAAEAAILRGPKLLVASDPESRCVCKGSSRGEYSKHAFRVLDVLFIKRIVKVEDEAVKLCKGLSLKKSDCFRCLCLHHILVHCNQKFGERHHVTWKC